MISVHNKSLTGFTLVEVMVVVAIIALLAGFVLPKAHQMVEKARITRTKAELNSIKSALELYYEENKEFPLLPSPPPWTTDTAKDDLNTWLVDYLDREIEGDPWRGEYEYGYKPNDYCYIGSWGPDGAKDSDPTSSHTCVNDDIYLWLE